MDSETGGRAETARPRVLEKVKDHTNDAARALSRMYARLTGIAPEHRAVRGETLTPL